MREGPARGQSLPREARITDGSEIRELFRRGRRTKTRNLDVFVSASPVSFSRLGLVVPKPRMKTSPTGRRVRAAAVQRNRLKRRLREIGRIWLLPTAPAGEDAVDVLIRARPEAYLADFGQLRNELLQARDYLW